MRLNARAAALLIAAPFLIGGLTACGEKTNEDKAEEAGDDAKDAADDMKDDAKDAVDDAADDAKDALDGLGK